MGRKIRVKLQDTTPARVITLDPAATEGATLGSNVFLPDGTVGTPASIKTYLGITTAPAVVNSGNAVHHHLLQGLTEGDDHPQYTRRDILTTEGDLYVRGSTAIERLGVGAEGEVLKIVGGVPAWALDERGVEGVIGTSGEIDVNDYDPAFPIVSLAAPVLAALALAESAVQPADLLPLIEPTYITEDDETALLVNSRRLVAGTNVTFDVATPGILEINASGGGGSGIVEAVIGTYGEIDVDDYDPAFPIVSLAAPVLASLALADSAAQPGDNISIFTNDVPYLVAADLSGYVQNSRQIISGNGLTGGGDLSADRTLAVGAGTGITVNADDVAVNINGLTQDSTPDGATDFVMTYDASAGTLKKVLLDDLPGGGGGGTVDTIVAGDGILVDDTDPANPIVSVDEAFDFDWTDDHDWIVNDNASRGNLFTNSSTGVSAAANWGLTVDTANFRIFVTGPNRSSAVVTSGPTGAQAVLRTLGNYPIVFGTNNTYRGQITGAGGVELEGTLQTGGTITSLVALVASAGSAASPTLRFSGDGDSGFYQISTSNQIGLSLGGSDAVRFINGGIPVRITGTSDPTQPSVRYSIYTTDFGTERAYWGFPTTGSDDVIFRNIAGDTILFRCAANSTRLQINDTTGLLYQGPVNYTGGVSSPEVGFRILPQNIQNGNYTAVLGDSGCHIYKASGGAGETITIPPNGGAGAVPYPIGTMLTFVNNGGGNLSIAITTDTLQMSPGGAVGTRTLADNGVATALKVASTVWKIWGTGLT